ncbi:MAG TPA: OmpA family protein [Phycisphaerales bacterium]|nr:OmpA family protein [Phycisphaerales bacterium]
MNVRRLTLLTIPLALTSLLGGCVGQGEYDRLYEVNASLTSQNKDLARQLEEERQAKLLLQKNGMSGETTVAALQRQNAALRAQLDKALADLNELNGKMAKFDFGPVNADTDAALTALAAQYPNLIKYDSARGMLRFASDLTFDSGSDAVKENAKEAIAALSQILNSSAASGYEVVIEGHTDSQRLSANTAQRHRTNRHLSAHRAISVTGELAKLGVANDRILAAGWGEFRPLVANTGNGNTPANRRVEIFLARGRGTGTQDSAPVAESPSTEPTKTTNVNDDIDITK